MTDKVQKIREEVERLFNHVKDSNFESDSGAFYYLKDLLDFIDSLQEEPKKCMYSKDDYTDEDRKVLCDGCEEECKYSESDDFTKALAECILQSQCNVVDPMVLAETWKDELIKLAKSEEPVSEDLEEELNKYIKDNFTIDNEQLDRFGIEEKDYMYSMDKSDMLALVEYFTNWQKQQFEKNRLAACDAQTEEEAEIERDFVMSIIEKEHRHPTFDDAIKYGMRLQCENMMKDATDVTVHIEAGNYPYIPQLELYDYDKDIPLAKEGDKYKVVLIKEE